jgi:hypothetical protein
MISNRLVTPLVNFAAERRVMVACEIHRIGLRVTALRPGSTFKVFRGSRFAGMASADDSRATFAATEIRTAPQPQARQRFEKGRWAQDAGASTRYPVYNPVDEDGLDGWEDEGGSTLRDLSCALRLEGASARRAR